MKNQKGFTLVELAIVLIIIGIILGAVLKGQDLIQNARIKKFDVKAKAWEVAVWTFYDRKGRFPGDADANGKIGDGNVKDDFVNANFINPPYEKDSTGNPVNSISIGSNTFYVYFGTDGGRDAGKNVMIICRDANCTANFSEEQAQYIQSFDTAIDGKADGTEGQVICGGKPNSVDSNTWISYYNTTPTGADCDTTAKAMIYYFDAKR